MVFLPGCELVEIRVRDKKEGERNGMEFYFVCGEIQSKRHFHNFKYIKNLWSFKEQVDVCTRWRVSYDPNSFFLEANKM